MRRPHSNPPWHGRVLRAQVVVAAEPAEAVADGGSSPWPLIEALDQGRPISVMFDARLVAFSCLNHAIWTMAARSNPAIPPLMALPANPSLW